MKITTKLLKRLNYMSLLSVLCGIGALTTGQWGLLTIGILVYLCNLVLPISLYVVHLVNQEEDKLGDTRRDGQ